MKKGISPLIAAVFLIAFVIAIAGIASNFFMGFTKQRQAEIEEKGKATVDCSVANFEVDPDTVSCSGGSSCSLSLYVKGDSDLTAFNMTVYDSTGSTDQASGASGTFSPGDSVSLSGSLSGLTAPLTKIKVTTPSCSGLSDAVENETGNTDWVAAELSDRV